VFSAWANPAAKARWFACHDDWEPTLFELDFRVGGHERLRTGPKGGTLHGFEGLYQDIRQDERIVYTYAMRLDETLISVSLATVEFQRAGAGTRLILTEQGAFLDGHDDVAGREEGTRIGLNSLATLLAGEHVAA
jgi:uncharacterized protein YndB with AHSA1/START domain